MSVQAEPATVDGPVTGFAALRYGEFRLLVLANFLLTIGLLAQEVTLGYALYQLTKDPLVLGLIGLAEALPFISLALFGGHLADRMEKRTLLVISLLITLASSAFLVWAAGAGLAAGALTWCVYAAVATIGVARVFFSPAASALKGFLVPRALYPNAATWASAGWQSGAILGPVVGGLLVAALGLQGSLMVSLGIFVATLLCLLGIKPRGVPVAEGEDDLWQSLAEGLHFVWAQPILLYSIALDLFSVLFGGVVAILPVFAADVLHVGPAALGLLRAAASVGALATLLVCVWLPPTLRPWHNLLWAVAGFGLATIVFALSKNYWLSALALLLTGAFDSVSVIIRSTILQVLPPDHLRGRVQSVNAVFVSSSNELGAFESGVAARLMGAVPSVLAGGVITLLIVARVFSRSKALLTVRL